MSVMPIELYTDGSCLNNPGCGGIGYVIRYTELDEETNLPKTSQIEKNQGYRLSTNNRMELLAGITGLQEIIAGVKAGTFKNVSSILMKSDSEHLCKGVNHRWIDNWQKNNWITSKQTPVQNRDLWELLISTITELKGMGLVLNIEHIKAHAGHQYNELADTLATSASKGTDHIVDEGYENRKK